MKCPKCKEEMEPICPECKSKLDLHKPWVSVLVLFIGIGIALYTMLLVILPGVYQNKFDNGYEQGQIDALKGTQHYDMIIQEKTDTVILKIK